VVPDRLKETTYRYKKALGGVLLRAQQRRDAYVAALQADASAPLSDQRLAEIVSISAHD
jgi:hypothetical protein